MKYKLIICLLFEKSRNFNNLFSKTVGLALISLTWIFIDGAMIRCTSFIMQCCHLLIYLGLEIKIDFVHFDEQKLLIRH